MPNYTLDGLTERIRAAKDKHADYLALLLNHYEQRSEMRRAKNIGVLAFCGYGRAGKDLSAEYLCRLSKGRLKYPGSLSMIALPIIATAAEDTEDHAWAHRHNVRDFWIEACHALRGDDYSLLLRLSLGRGDVVAGVRGLFKIDDISRRNVVAGTIWVRNNRVEKDKTVEYDEEDCNCTIVNNGSRLELFARLRKFVGLLQAGYSFGEV